MSDLLNSLKQWLKQRAGQLGFQQLGVAGIGLGDTEQRLHDWLAAGMQGEMSYMQRHGTRRTRPAELEPGTLRVISLRMDHRPAAVDPWSVLEDPSLGYVSRYALGRDYHKLLRKRLQTLASELQARAGEATACRVFVDSAPVMEKPLAQLAGLGWQGKHTNLINRSDGGWFFLGEIYTDLPLPIDQPEPDHCGRCQACIEICPTRAIIAPYRLDARRCISYLTIEHHGPIPLELRSLLGNRIYGCDDCLLVCPWNRFARISTEPDFKPRQGLDAAPLSQLIGWNEAEFLRRTEGSAIRRIGHQRWQRNLAVALGNGPPSDPAIRALETARTGACDLVTEHIDWALDQLRSRQSSSDTTRTGSKAGP